MRFFKKRYILHVIYNHDFFNSVYREFQYFEGDNVYVSISKKGECGKLRGFPVYFVNKYFFLLCSPILHLFFKGMILHSIFSDFLYYIVRFSSNKLKVFWFAWGFDNNKMLDNATDLLDKLNYEYYIKNLKGESKYGFFHKNVSQKNEILSKKIFPKIDFISTVLYEEYEAISARFGINNKYIEWNYLNMEDDIIKGLEGKVIKGNNLLLGNSSSVFNNHLDSLIFLDDCSEFFENIICPLSYGDFSYSKEVEYLGIQLFSSRFISLNSYMKYSEYVNLISTCRYFYVGGFRQIGLGNIVVFLYMGGVLIMDHRNPIFAFLREKSIPVFSKDEISDAITFFPNISDVREKLLSIWGKERKMKILMNIFEKI